MGAVVVVAGKDPSEVDPAPLGGEVEEAAAGVDATPSLAVQKPR